MTEQLDAKWHVPDSYDITERTIALPPPAALLPTAPMLGILSVRALEDQATGTGLFALVTWQTIAGASALAALTLDQLAHTPDLAGIELLTLGHAYVATGTGEGAAFEIAQRARKILKQPVTPQSIEASLLLASTALPYGVERVRTLLDMLEPELAQGTDEHLAVHALIRAAADPSPARLDDAHTKLAALDDAFGLAQCALLAYARELETTKRPALLRGYLEHAIYRYELDGRPDWAARTITHSLVPLLISELKAPALEVTDLLARAAALAVQARSQLALKSVFRTASKLGYAATVNTLNEFDPPSFAPRAANAAPPQEEAPKAKKPAAKKTKKKAAS
ncbi:MAG: hypothetical protein H0T42_19670 [Deltaproteobacteria bacterium]|nr:hypothetical protein [Deltaproteobacteria bacterium]